MLLLTDAPAGSLPLKQTFGQMEHCTMLALAEACKRPAVHPMIACHIDFDDAGSQRLLGSALAHHRADTGTPVLFLARDVTDGLSAQADALGSAEILPENADRERLLFWIKRCKILHKERIYGRIAPPAQVAETQTRQSVEGLGNDVFAMMGSARQNQPISLASLERSADSLLASVKRVQLREWLNVVRQYDDATYQHCLLVAGLVASFSLKLGLSAGSQHLLSQAALIHDIGKARTPQSILNKPGKLTSSEFDVMRRHAAEGHKMLATQAGIHPSILDVVRHHHELLDGSGYPDGLKGKQVSDVVRMVTICDIYAALIERRSYKAPMPADQSRAILIEMGGKLDRGLVEAFDSVIRDC